VEPHFKLRAKEDWKAPPVELIEGYVSDSSVEADQEDDEVGVPEPPLGSYRSPRSTPPRPPNWRQGRRGRESEMGTLPRRRRGRPA
jgi:hypothetical protein